MRVLPVGVPKVMVSTLASGNVAAYVGSSDLCMMHSVTDVAGLNRISRVVLANAAHALAGMISGASRSALSCPSTSGDRPALGMTMFGVTTACVERLRVALEPEHDCLVFHATGTGGRALEKLVDSELVVAVLDVTTTEIADHLCGGILSAGADRLGCLERRSLPWVGSLGALDMVNFGSRESVPEHYRGRLFHIHNPQVTLMRTTPEECTRIGRFMAEKLNRARGPLRLLVPELGLSDLDREGGPFWDPQADAALFAALEEDLHIDQHHRLLRVPAHVNDPEFADELLKQFRELRDATWPTITPAR
jgi:uncharacterized protein (UPF0261 family)